MSELAQAFDIEEKVIDFKKPFKHTYEMKPLNRMFNDFQNDARLFIQFSELQDTVATDYQIYEKICHLMNFPIPFDEGFTRELGLGMLKKLKEENPASLMQHGKYLVDQCLNLKDCSVVLKEGEIFGVLRVSEEEPGTAVTVQLALRGEDIQRGRAAAALTKLWHNGYINHWYKKGYRFIWANAFSPEGKRFLKAVGEKEDPNVFSFVDAHRLVRFRNKLHSTFNAKWDLKKKYEAKKA